MAAFSGACPPFPAFTILVFLRFSNRAATLNKKRMGRMPGVADRKKGETEATVHFCAIVFAFQNRLPFKAISLIQKQRKVDPKTGICFPLIRNKNFPYSETPCIQGVRKKKTHRFCPEKKKPFFETPQRERLFLQMFFFFPDKFVGFFFPDTLYVLTNLARPKR